MDEGDTMLENFDLSDLQPLLLSLTTLMLFLSNIKERKNRHEGVIKRLGEKVINQRRDIVYTALITTVFEHPIYTITQKRDDECTININTSGQKKLYLNGNIKVTLYYLDEKNQKL